MKHFTLNFFAIVTIALLLSSCGAIKLPTTTSSTKTQAPYFTTVDKVVKLKVGMSFKEVEKTLGVPAYDMYNLSDDAEESAYIWYYKVLDRMEDPDVLETRAGAKSGDEKFARQQKLIVTFDDSRKLLKATTDSGNKKRAANVTVTNIKVEGQTAPPKKIWEFWK